MMEVLGNALEMISCQSRTTHPKMFPLFSQDCYLTSTSPACVRRVAHAEIMTRNFA